MLISEVTQNSSTMTHCVGKGCEYVLTTEEKFLSVNNRLKAMDACCSCGVLTCMRCKLRGHEPITCKMFKEWDGNLEKVMDALNEEWRSKNTKPCPKCKVDIEKNQGCMAMSCRNCKTRYCWNCLSTETVHYGGKCLKYKRDDSLDFSEEYLKRLQFYCDRYLEQQRSFEFNLERYQKISKKLNETSSIFQKVNTEITPRCLEFYLDAVKFIAKSRSFIIYTYPLAFQIMGERRTDLFSQTQYFLQYALEVFDDYIEKHPLDLLIDQNETGYCLRAKFSSIKAKILELETNLFKQFQNARKDFCDPDFLLSVELDFKDRQRALKSRKEGKIYSLIF